MNLIHIDLFSGIGGFALAAGWAGFKTTVFCEKDKFCQKVLNKHWPHVPIIEDIHDFTIKKYREEVMPSEVPTTIEPTILTGGFP
jgi:DNA (cytosine-5)-methyltransferase 1